MVVLRKPDFSSSSLDWAWLTSMSEVGSEESLCMASSGCEVEWTFWRAKRAFSSS